MATKRIIAHVMSEDELIMAERLLGAEGSTESFAMGEATAEQVAELQAAGILVEEVLAGPPETAVTARRSLSATRDIGLWAPTPAEDVPVPPLGVVTEWLVQLTGPLRHEWQSELAARDVELVEYLPTFCYVARSSPEAAGQLIGLPFVDDVRYFGTDVTGPVALAEHVEERGLQAPELVAWDALVADEAVVRDLVAFLNERKVPVVGATKRKVRFEAAPGDPLLDNVVLEPGVMSVVEFVPPTLQLDLARQLVFGVGPSPAGLTGNQGAFLGLDGEDEVVAVADTGLDDAHPDFAGRIVGLVGLGRPGLTTDPNGHGTHVAGTILGDGSSSSGEFTGIAPKSQLYFQSVLDARGELGGLPIGLEDLFGPAYEAGARVHNDSWGAATSSAYTINSQEVDEFVATHRDFLVIVAAGNAGTGSSPLNAQPGFVDWFSITSPASCKNALTVGAQRSGRTLGGLSGKTYGEAWGDDFPTAPTRDTQVSGDPEGLAAFSSRGPCDDRRIKPDLVAPGTDILATRSAIAPTENFWGEYQPNDKYAFMGGTSMAAPVVAGCATLVRQWYRQQRGVAAPSAALVKATLINGTRRLTGADSLADWDRLPNYHQGFGALDMTTTLPEPDADWSLEFVEATDGQALASTGVRRRYVVDVVAGRPLRICLTYTDRPGRGLQNHLLLLVQGPDGPRLVGNSDRPNSLNMPDADNNVKVVRIDAPATGRYLIQVSATNLLIRAGEPAQDFALVVSGDLQGALTPVP
jgi:serine protease AprX